MSLRWLFCSSSLFFSFLCYCSWSSCCCWNGPGRERRQRQLFCFFFPSSFVFVVGLHVDQAASQLPPGTKNTRVLAKTRRGRKKNIGNINKAPVRPGTFSRKTPIWRELNTPRKQKTNTLGGTENTPPGTKNTLPSAYSSFENVEVGALKSYSSHDFYNFWPRIPD